MNYEKNYYDYINYVKTLNRKKNLNENYELHHIIPKSLGGKDIKENLIFLTYREHYLAHYLLWKIYRNKQMLYAFWLMNIMPKYKIKLNSHLYEIARTNFIKDENKKSCKKVICLETGEIFCSLINASKKYNLKDSWSIAISINNKKRVAAGYHWDYYDENIDYTKNKFYGKKKYNFAIVRLEDAKIYYGYKSASLDNNIAIGTLSTVIAKDKFTAAGYHWDYYDENIDYTKNKFYGKRKSNGNKIKVICLETGEIFSSQLEAAKHFGIKTSGDIKRACSDKKNTTAGYHWDYYDENIDYTKNKFYGEEKSKGIKIICLETGKVFDSLKKAASSMNICSSSLTNHLKGNQKTFGGFHWKKYYED